MTTLTSNATITIGDGATATETISLSVVAAPIGGSGKGRLVHPTIGTIDYDRQPDRTDGMRGDAHIAPVWASSKALRGTANTLFAGDLRDVVCMEHWTQPFVTATFADVLQSIFVNPPNPSGNHVIWYPSYLNAFGFKVVITDFSLGGNRGVSTFFPRHGAGTYDRGPMSLTMRLIEKIEA
jgi:hypothetical protein